MEEPFDLERKRARDRLKLPKGQGELEAEAGDETEEGGGLEDALGVEAERMVKP